MPKREKSPRILGGPFGYRWLRLPELELFDEDQRWSDIRVHIPLLKIACWSIGGGLVAFSAFSGIQIAVHNLPLAPSTRGLLFAIVMPIICITVPPWLYFRAIRIAVRRRLIEVGVPVCMECGYCLRGLPGETQQCPECGKLITLDVRALMSKETAHE